MRAVGAGRARLGDLELDLTLPPTPVRLQIAEPVRTEAEQRAAAEERADAVRFAAGAGRRVRLPMGGGT